MRLTNRRLLHNKFQSQSGYFYILEFPASIKVGFSKNYEGRISYLGGKILEVVAGPTNDLADLEFDILVKFQDCTLLSSDGSRYTEFMDKKISKEVIKFVNSTVKKSKNLSIIK
jgi:hypothetical protein